MEVKTKFNRNNLTILTSLILVFLIISSTTTRADEAEYLGMTYNKFVTPEDNLLIIVNMDWKTVSQRVFGNILVYYTINALFSLEKAATQIFVPTDPYAENFYLELELPGLVDEDIIRFKVWFQWRGWVLYGEILTELGKASYETGAIPSTTWDEISIYVYVGIGLLAVVVLLYFFRKRRGGN